MKNSDVEKKNVLWEIIKTIGLVIIGIVGFIGYMIYENEKNKH